MGNISNSYESEGELMLPQPEEISSREKEDAMGAYLMMFAAWAIGIPLPFFNLIAAVIYHFLNRKTSPFVGFHSLQSLTSQIFVSLINAGTIVWLTVIIVNRFAWRRLVASRGFFVFLIFAAAANILYIVFSIIALSRAKKGRFYYMPFFGRFAYSSYYGTEAK